MARIRSIKPQFFLNEELAELEPITRLFFIGLWCHADREGRLEDRPKRLKMEILPYEDEADIEAMLKDLDASGFILRYAVDETKFIQVVAFTKHQRPHHKETKSIIPQPSQTPPLPEKANQGKCHDGESQCQPAFSGGGGFNGNQSGKSLVVKCWTDSNTPTTANVVPRDLTDVGRLSELHQQAIDRGWAGPAYLGPGGQLDFFAASVHARRITNRDGGDACKLFAWIVRKGQWHVVTNADEVSAHERLREHLHPSLPRSTTPSLSGDARLVRCLLQVVRRHGCHDPPERLYGTLSDRLGDAWTAERWDDACAELNDGSGPVPVGRLTETLLARYEVTAPTLKLFEVEPAAEAVA